MGKYTFCIFGGGRLGFRENRCGLERWIRRGRMAGIGFCGRHTDCGVGSTSKRSLRSEALFSSLAGKKRLTAGPWAGFHAAAPGRKPSQNQ